MSFDLAVWEGPVPESDEAASQMYEQLTERLESVDDASPPTPAIRSYVDALLARWPDIDQEGGEDSPWSSSPLIEGADGEIFYFAMVWSRADEAAVFAAEVAREHGLVCYDPQSEWLLPHDAPRRRWFGRRR